MSDLVGNHFVGFPMRRLKFLPDASFKFITSVAERTILNVFDVNHQCIDCIDFEQISKLWFKLQKTAPKDYQFIGSSSFLKVTTNRD